jgi:hypothetical protein
MGGLSVARGGWAPVNVRRDLHDRLLDMARGRGLTVDELLRELLSNAGASAPRDRRAAEWASCPRCGARVKAGNLKAHVERVHGS